MCQHRYFQGLWSCLLFFSCYQQCWAFLKLTTKLAQKKYLSMRPFPSRVQKEFAMCGRVGAPPTGVSGAQTKMRVCTIVSVNETRGAAERGAIRSGAARVRRHQNQHPLQVHPQIHHRWRYLSFLSVWAAPTPTHKISKTTTHEGVSPRGRIGQHLFSNRLHRSPLCLHWLRAWFLSVPVAPLDAGRDRMQRPQRRKPQVLPWLQDQHHHLQVWEVRRYLGSRWMACKRCAG